MYGGVLNNFFILAYYQKQTSEARLVTTFQRQSSEGVLLISCS